MINFNQIVAPLQLVIVQWVNTYPLTAYVRTLHDLTNAEFFLHLLTRIKHFTFLEPPTYTIFIDITLAQRISRMKLIGRSIMRHLNSELSINTGEMQLNYIQMCKGNREECIRMVIMLLAIVTRNELIKHKLEQYTTTCTQDSAALFNIMIDYAGKIGEGQQQRTDSTENKQKRLITRLEIVQEQVEFYEEYTKQLEIEIESMRQQSTRQKIKLSEFQAREKEMLLKLEQLQQTGEQYSKQLSLHEQREELLNSRINNNRQVADEVVDRLTQQLQQQKTETYYYKTQLEKYNNVEANNRDLITANNQYRADLQATKLRLNRSLEALKIKQANICQLEERCQQLAVQNDGLRLKLELMQKSYGHNDTMHYSPQQKSITCHNPLSQSFSGSHTASPLFTYQTRLQELNDRNDLSQSLTIAQSNYIEDKTVHQRHKQNINMFNVVSQPGNLKHYMDEINEQRSVQLSLSQLEETAGITPTREMESDLLLQIALDLYQNLEFLKGQVNKYRQLQAKKAERKSVFMKKVNRMFS